MDFDQISLISDLVKNQLPNFYKTEGQTFIDFLKCYYQFLEKENSVIDQSLHLYKQFDIDFVNEKFLEHFKNVYIDSIPMDLLGNYKLLQKHILELYTSKGSDLAYKFLFRLLFNDDVDLYLPRRDILRFSDNIYYSPRYIEVTFSESLKDIVEKRVTGSISGATALVEQYVETTINNKNYHILYVSNIMGRFQPKEYLIVDGYITNQYSTIIGSVSELKITSSAPNFKPGDVIETYDSQNPVKASVLSVKDGMGILEFVIEKPGSYYSLDAKFTIDPGHLSDYIKDYKNVKLNASAYGFPKNPTNNANDTIISQNYIDPPDNILPPLVDTPTGTGAHIEILSIINTHWHLHNEDKLPPVVYSGLNGTFNFPKKPDADINSVIGECLSFENIEVGEIHRIRVYDPGVNYTVPTYFIPIDPYTSTLELKDANGEQVGANGLVVGYPITGNSIIDKVVVIDSGFDNTTQQYLLKDKDFDRYVLANSVYGGVGTGIGNYQNDNSFLSDNKYLFDGYYYQDFSYVLSSTSQINFYLDVLKRVVHPTGLLMFHDIKSIIPALVAPKVIDIEVNTK